jgi:Protein of unknown function (DUF4242)
MGSAALCETRLKSYRAVTARLFAPGQLWEINMPRYLVERSFPSGLSIPMNAEGSKICRTVVAANAEKGVTWVHSYVTPDRTKTFCIYDGPTPESIRQAAKSNGQPVDTVTEVSVLDPYFYRS